MKECREFKERYMYKYGEFYVEIRVAHNGDKEAWIQHEDYGIATLMFGLEGKPYIIFKEVVESNLDEYIELYREEYMND